MAKVLEVSNVQKYYGSKGNLTKALDDISFSVESGEYVGIMGASGSGKTTLLNCVSTIDVVSAGKILLGDRDVTLLRGEALNAFRRDELGFIFQDFNLLDTMTAFENIALALSIQKVPVATIKWRRLQPGLGLRRCWINTRIRCPVARSSAWPAPELW